MPLLTYINSEGTPMEVYCLSDRVAAALARWLSRRGAVDFHVDGYPIVIPKRK